MYTMNLNVFVDEKHETGQQYQEIFARIKKMLLQYHRETCTTIHTNGLSSTQAEETIYQYEIPLTVQHAVEKISLKTP